MLVCMPRQKDENKPTQYAQEFAGRLTDALGSMKRTELARLITESGLELEPGRLTHYFSGRNYPDPPILAAICKALGISADWVLGLTETDTPVAELEEKLAAATGEDRINKLMRGMSKAKQKQVLDFAEYLFLREMGREQRPPHVSRLPAEETQRNLAIIRTRLDLVEDKWGIDGRRDMERRIREEFGSGDFDQ